jgi:hypothetical protein
LINGILLTILESNRNAGLYSGVFGREAEVSLDNALDNWQRLWHVDPKSHSSGPSSAFGAMAFNASAVYRAACIRRVRDYSRYPPLSLDEIWHCFVGVLGCWVELC